MPTQLDVIFNLIDSQNSADPVLENSSGQTRPRALLYGQRMSEQLNRFCPDASMALQIAARAQHLCRWQIPRSDYPLGRSGYLTWRRNLAQHHARLAGDLMQTQGLGKTLIERVQILLQKKNLKGDKETQALEDVACLVFLKHDFAALSRQHAPEKIIAIVAKTWKKMSPQGHAAALAMTLPAEQQALINAALQHKSVQ